ncbi:GDSL-type esterase/lipase family protein [Mycoplasma sp. Mirounga ES2805-ORL]|uniref:GDSL-type esterase/lipase family protein n=1 Tax=Mycoplasma sp. Mirounga ES2805-ORL TaxID=754514 RepID=UPI00197BDAE2|nr:GDSL-type esterase/lipase family protein [Mycoplasma sp. Mirounga ES2805-ORL]QSF13432.1 hypothetical protein JXZ90_02015 [Mycoplasma sp. Mirounga ES2805-ORL]
MKLKLKNTLLIISGALVGTIGLSIGLSLIAVNERKIKKVYNVEKNNNNTQDNKLPGLPNTEIIEEKENDKPKSNIKKSKRLKSEHSISKNQRVKYVALGDSISAGWDGRLDKDYEGELVNNEIQGISFPSYLAKMIKDAEDGKLESFKNFARSGSTLNEWNLLFNNKVSELKPEELKALQKVFGNNLEEFKNSLISKLQEANLITITLGANDCFDIILKQMSNISLGNLITQIINKKPNYEEIVKYLNNTFGDIFDKVQERQIELIRSIKIINSRANINFIGYPVIAGAISALVDNYLQQNFNVPVRVVETLTNLINNKIKYVANKQKINFISSYETDFWLNNVKDLSPLLFDIHPSTFGYKKMAFDVFTKLSISDRDINDLKSKNINWSEDYVQTDQDSFYWQIEYKNDVDNFIKNIHLNSKKYILEHDKLFKKFENKISINNYKLRVLDDRRFASMIFDNALMSFLNSNLYKELDPSELLKKFLTKDKAKNLNQLKNWLISNHVVSNFVMDIQRYFETYDWDNDGKPGAKVQSISNLFKAVKKIILDEEKIIKTISSLSKINFIREEKEELKNIIKIIFSNFVSKKISNETINKIVSFVYSNELKEYLSKNDLFSIIKFTINSEPTRTLIAKLLESFIVDAEKYGNAKSFSDLWKIFIANSEVKEALKTFSKNIIVDLTKDSQFKKTISNVIAKTIGKKTNFLVGDNIESDVSEQELSELLFDVVGFYEKIDDEYKITDKVVSIVLGNISGLEFKDLKEFDYSKLVNDLNNEFILWFEGVDKEKTIIKFIKLLLRTDVSNHKETITKLLTNVLRNKDKNNNSIFKKLIYQFIYQPNKNKFENLISEQDFLKSLDAISNLDEYKQLIASVVNKFFEMDNTKLDGIQTYFDLFKVLSDGIVNSKVYDNLLKIKNKLLEMPAIKKAFRKYLLNWNAQNTINLNVDAVNNILNNLMIDQSFKNIFQDFIDNCVFRNGATNFNHLKTKEAYINWFRNSQTVNNNASSILNNLINSKEFRNIVSELSLSEIKKTEFSQGFSKDDDVKFKELISDILRIFPKLNEKFKLTNLYLKDLSLEINSLWEQKNLIDFSINWFRKYFGSLDEEKIFSLLKNVLSNHIIDGKQDTIKKIITNSLKVTINSKWLENKYNSYPSSTEDKFYIFIKKYLPNYNNVKPMLSRIVDQSAGFNNLLDNILDSLSNETNKYNEANSINEVVKIFIGTNNNVEKLEKNFTLLLKDILSQEEFKNIIKGLWKDNLGPYDMNPESSENQSLLDDLIKEAPNIVQSLGIVKEMVVTIRDNISSYDSFSSFAKNVVVVLTNNLSFKKYEFVAQILKLKLLKKHKTTIQMDVKQLIKSITEDSSGEKIKKFVDDYNLSNMLMKHEITYDDSLKFFKHLFKSKHLRNLLDILIDEVISNSTNNETNSYGKPYSELKLWSEAIKKLFNTSKVSNIKQELKSWMKESFTDNKVVGYTMGSIVFNMLKDKGYNLEDDKDKVIVQEFVYEFAKSSFEVKANINGKNKFIFDEIVDILFNNLKNMNTFDPDVLIKIVTESVQKGALSFITNPETGKVSLSRIFGQINFFDSLLSEKTLKPETIANMINLLFDKTPNDENKGIFKVMFNTQNGNSDFEVGNGFWGIIQGKLTDMIAAFAKPLVRNYFNELRIKPKYNNINELKQKSKGLSAIWRFYSLFASILYENTPKSIFWNGTSFTAEAYLMSGFLKAIDDVEAQYTDVINKYSNNLSIIGYDSANNFNENFISGYQTLTSGWFGKYNSRSRGLSNTFYGRDHVLVYIYYHDNYDSKYNPNKTKRQVLMEDLIKGYMPVRDS